jgi:DNA polymerase-3 subunit epsilon
MRLLSLQVCETLLQWLDHAVLCAHNVRFDYGFSKTNSSALVLLSRRNCLCTVKLSRKLYPQHHSHSLNAIIERFQLICTQRHRAMGDTEMMAAFIEIAINEFGESTVQETVKTLLKQQATPNLDHLGYPCHPGNLRCLFIPWR